MKKIQHLIFSILSFCLSSQLTAQTIPVTYFSNFTTTTGTYSSSIPNGGGLCTSIGVTWSNPVNTTNADLVNDFSTLSIPVGVSLACTNNFYGIRAKLNLPAGVTEVPGGFMAGFRMKSNGLLSLAVLTSGVSLATYNAGVLQEVIGGSSLINLNILTTTGIGDIYCYTLLPFDEVELRIGGGSLLLAAVIKRFDTYFAYGTSTVTLSNKSELTGVKKQNKVMLGWDYASGNSSFDIERSYDAIHFSSIGNVSTSSTGSHYVYNDDVTSLAQNNLYYRVKINNGTNSLYSNIIKISGDKITDVPNVTVMPNIVSIGQTINVSVSKATAEDAILISDIFGNAMQTIATPSTGNYLISSNKLGKGIYVVSLMQEHKVVANTKIIVQ